MRKLLKNIWNNNLAIIINKEEEEYIINLLIYEEKSENIPESLETRLVDSSIHIIFIKNKVKELQERLIGEKPILYSSPTLRLCYDKKYCFRDVKITTFDLPFSDLEKNPDRYIKPLDIMKNCWEGRSNKKREEREMWHSAIYLGKKKVCHARPLSYYYDYAIGPGLIEVIDWNKYLKFALTSPFKLVCFHPIIPYFKKKMLIQHLAKSIEGSKNFYKKRGEFSLEKNNCEQFVNLVTYGIDISENLEIRKVQREDREAKENKAYDLEKELEKSHNFFNDLTSSQNSEKIEQIEDYVNSPHHPQGYKLKEYIEVKPKSDYQIVYKKN